MEKVFNLIRTMPKFLAKYIERLILFANLIYFLMHKLMVLI